MKINWYGVPLAAVWALLLVLIAVVAISPLVALAALIAWYPPDISRNVILSVLAFSLVLLRFQ